MGPDRVGLAATKSRLLLGQQPGRASVPVMNTEAAERRSSATPSNVASTFRSHSVKIRLHVGGSLPRTIAGFPPSKLTKTALNIFLRLKRRVASPYVSVSCCPLMAGTNLGMSERNDTMAAHITVLPFEIRIGPKTRSIVHDGIGQAKAREGLGLNMQGATPSGAQHAPTPLDEGYGVASGSLLLGGFISIELALCDAVDRDPSGEYISESAAG